MESTVPHYSEWKPFDLNNPSLHMVADDLDDVRRQLLQLQNPIHQKLVMANEVQWKRLRTNEFSVHQPPEHADAISRWLHELDLDIPYRGEGLPGMTLKVLTALLRRKRLYLSAIEKR